MPAVKQVLAGPAIDYFERQAGGDLEWLNRPRPRSLALQQQFSEALGQFGNYAVPRIVAAHDGAVLDTSGDKVLAVVPISQALDCLHGLRLAFQGSAELPAAYPDQFAPTARGFIRLAESNRRAAEPSWPLLVPGPQVALSACLAVGSGREPVEVLMRSAHTRGDADGVTHPDELTVRWLLDGRLEWLWNEPMNSPAVRAMQLLTGRSGGDSAEAAWAQGTAFLQKLRRRLGAYVMGGASAAPAWVSLPSEMRAILEAEMDRTIRSEAFAGAGLAGLRNALSDYVREWERTKASPPEVLNWLRLTIWMRQTRG